jgi:arginyl-tRNA synthetase
MEKIKTEMEDGERKKVARMVSAAAIKFSFLRTGSEKRITFKWEEALNMEGDSGPYLQYAYVRTQGILGKTKEKPSVEEVGFNPQEKQLIRKLAQFQDMVARSAKELAPHHLAQYSIDVAGDFSSFYTTSPVLTAEDDRTRRTRLAITLATSIVLRNSLGLIGIECPERM